MIQDVLMRKDKFLRIKAPTTLTPALQLLQAEIAELYEKLCQLQPSDEAAANELIRSIRLLEEELVAMRKAQPGYSLHL